MTGSIKILACSFLLLAYQNAQSEEVRSTSSDQHSINLTVYNQGRALVRDHRVININQPTSQIALMDVAGQIMPQTVAITGLDVLEQNYDYDLLSPQTLVEKNIGKSVRIARRSGETGETLEWTEGVIMSNNGGVILQLKDGSLESLNNNAHYHMVFNEVPQNLRTSPTLSLLLKKPVIKKQAIELTYLTQGMSWQSDYVLQLDKSETRANLDSWITLNNQSGIGYQKASLQLLAGDVNIYQPQPAPMMAREMMMRSSSDDSAISQQALHGYHLYTVPHKTSINNNQSKQIKLFSADAIPVQKYLKDQSYVDSRGLVPQKSKPEQFLKIKNSKPALGSPLPKGTIRVYANDAKGNKQFIGEDGIEHTAVNDEFEIRLGKSFDISLQRKTISVRKISAKQTELKREIKINNGSENKQALLVSEIMPSQDWRIKKSSWSHTQISPSEVEFEISIEAMTELVLSYEVVITYP